MDLQTKKEKIIMHLAEKHAPFHFFSKDEFLDMVDKNIQPFRRLMSFYRCAMMEIETKFKVLNEEMSLESERNPIESIKTRIKSTDSLVRKMNKKQIPLSIEELEKTFLMWPESE